MTTEHHFKGKLPYTLPLVRRNHNWSAARAREGLEPYARARAAKPVSTAK